MRAETGSSRPSAWDDRPRIDKAGQNRRSDGWKSDVDELKDAESGLDAAGIVIEFNMIDMGIAEEMNKRMDKMMKNFQSGK